MAVVIFLCCLLGGIAIGLPIAWSLLLAALPDGIPGYV